MNNFLPLFLVQFLVIFSGIAQTPAGYNRTLYVGPGATYQTPCQAFKEAQDGDTIEIDGSGNYDGDVCRILANNLTIRGVNGRPKIDAAGQSAEERAIWIFAGNDITVENIELSGCRVPTLNGAGLWPQGTNLTVRSCYFHDNENGILCGVNPSSEIVIENTEFASNGHGDGQSHNIYIGNIKKFTMRFCYSHHSRKGHLVKSRAAENHILYNRLTEEGSSSYKIDLPNGGLAYVIGNLIQQSQSTSNSNMLSFGEEGPTPGSRLLVVNNTFVNDRQTGAFVKVHPSVTLRAMLVNNIFAGPGEITTQEKALTLSNFVGQDPGFMDRAGFDYHLKLTSPCIDAGADLKELGLDALTPRNEYVHSRKSKPRTVVGPIDIGAHEK